MNKKIKVTLEVEVTEDYYNKQVSGFKEKVISGQFQQAFLQPGIIMVDCAFEDLE